MTKLYEQLTNDTTAQPNLEHVKVLATLRGQKVSFLWA